MRSLRGHATFTFAIELPDDDAVADDAFDTSLDAMLARLNPAGIPNVFPDSFAVADADTEPEHA